ncbi:MAG: hypothetical protein LBI42_04745 [Chitinispirillales bacterium]|jgi:hypothetical protein|nr:hypothetical protein [Chitinispirillales bacterium]
MHVGAHARPDGYCGSSSQKTEVKTNTQSCGTNFSKVLNQSVGSCKSSPVKTNGNHGSSHGSHGLHGSHGPRLIQTAGHSHSPHFNHNKPSLHGTPCMNSTAQKPLQLTIQSQTYVSVSYNSYSYTSVNAGSANFNQQSYYSSTKSGTAGASAGSVQTGANPLSMTRTDRFYSGANMLLTKHGYKPSDLTDNKTGNLCPDKLKTAYQKHGYTNLSDGLQKEWELEYKVSITYKTAATSLKDILEKKGQVEDDKFKMLMDLVSGGKVSGGNEKEGKEIEDLLNKIIEAIQTALSTNSNKTPDDIKNMLKDVLQKGENNNPEMATQIVVKKEEFSLTKAA